MNYVLDASAMIAYLRGEPGKESVFSALLDPHSICFAHALNLCEVFYDFHRKAGDNGGDRVLEEIRITGIIRREDVSPSFCRTAAALKSEFRRISLADCFAVALSRELNARLLTTDRHELESLAATGRFDIAFIR